jgi:hypothetical protein
MIGLMFLGVFALWIWFAVYLGLKIPKWLGWKWRGLISALLIPLFIVTPIVDEVIGKKQFAKLCEKTSFNITNDANLVKRAVAAKAIIKDLSGYWLPIQQNTYQYFDKDTGRVFFSYVSFHTDGGWLFGRSYIFGTEKFCDGKTITEIEKKLNLKQLLEQGEKS